MKRATNMLTCLAMLSWGGMAAGSEAGTWANAGGSRQGNGLAEASARYEGDVRIARTQTRSGRVNIARGLAVGFDRDGLSLSTSSAISLPNGLAAARNFNLSIGRNGEVAVSGGNTDRLRLAASRRPVRDGRWRSRPHRVDPIAEGFRERRHTRGTPAVDG